MSQRLSYPDSVRLLQEHGFLKAGAVPPLPPRMPAPDGDNAVGVEFYKTGVWDDELPNVTLPRTFIGRSEVSHISFRNADLHESYLCWNDFIDVDFTESDLSRCDLRASRFEKVTFAGADLSEADLRHATFECCDFTGARMRGLKLSREAERLLPLSEAQRGEIEWREDEGEEPPGG